MTRSKDAPEQSDLDGWSDRFIVLLRHGIAEDRNDAKADEERRLTDKGNARMKLIGRGMATLFPAAEVIYSSPLVRCMETAAWVRRGYRERIAIEATDALVPTAAPEELRELLARSRDQRQILFVGHEPTLSRNMASLTGMVGKYSFELRKGGCYGLRIPSESASAELEWILPPRALRLMC